MRTVAQIAAGEEVPSSMRAAMAYPADSATDADRVEWLQLNLLLQFQTVYKSALCQTSIYQPNYAPGEQQRCRASSGWRRSTRTSSSASPSAARSPSRSRAC